MRKEETIRIGLYCFGKSHTIDKYGQILTLYNLMRSDPRFTTFIVIDGTGQAEKDLTNLYHDEIYDIRENDVNNLDVLIIIDPYNKPYVPYDQIKIPIVYKEYGTAGVEASAGYLIRKPVYKYADLIITENSYMGSKIREVYPDKDVIVGSPAFDYVNYLREDKSKYGDGKINVIWSPHHTIFSHAGFDKVEGGIYSTFLTYKDYFANEFLDDFPQVNLHFKPHPILRNRYNSKFKGFKDYLKSFNHPDRVYIHEKEDYHQLFMDCDIILNDSISFIQEWLPTNKPMVVLEDESKSKYSPFGEQIIDECYYRAGSVEEIRNVLSKLLSAEDPKLESRKEFSKDLFVSEGSSNSEVLVNFIYNLYS